MHDNGLSFREAITECVHGARTPGVLPGMGASGSSPGGCPSPARFPAGSRPENLTGGYAVKIEIAGARWSGPRCQTGDDGLCYIRHGMIPLVPPCRESGISGPSLSGADFRAGNGRVPGGLPSSSFRAYSAANPYSLLLDPVRPGWHRCGLTGQKTYIFAANSRHGITRDKLTHKHYKPFFVKFI